MFSSEAAKTSSSSPSPPSDPSTPSPSTASRRDLEELFLRATDESDESGAVSVSEVLHWGEVLVPGVISGVKQLVDEQ